MAQKAKLQAKGEAILNVWWLMYVVDKVFLNIEVSIQFPIANISLSTA